MGIAPNLSSVSTQRAEALSLAHRLAYLPPSDSMGPPKLQHCPSQLMILSTNKCRCRKPSGVLRYSYHSAFFLDG